MCHLSLINLSLRTSGESYWRRYDGQELNVILDKHITVFLL